MLQESFIIILEYIRAIPINFREYREVKADETGKIRSNRIY